MKKVKILHVIKSLGRGGAEILLLESLKLHDLQKFEFHYIYFLNWVNQIDKELEKEGGKVVCFPANNNLGLLFQYRKIIKYCKENEIDIIHAHLPWSGFVGRLVHKKIKIPMFYTEHSLLERYHPITKVLNRITYNYQTLAIGVSESVSTSIKKNTKTNIPLHTILNGVDQQSFRCENIENNNLLRKKLLIPEDAIIIGIIAVYKIEKRLNYWLEILEKCISENDKIYGLIVGVGKKEENALLKNRTSKLENRVIFTGFKKNVYPYYSIMDIFMMSSLYEGLPMALLEAMSMDCAIITTDAGGIKEVIRDQKDGYIFSVEDWEKLSESCLQLARDSYLLEDFKKKAKTRVISNFKLMDSIKKLEQLYLEYTKNLN